MKRTASAIEVPGLTESNKKQMIEDQLEYRCKKFVLRFNEMMSSLRQHMLKADDDMAECEQRNFEEGVDYIRIRKVIVYYQNVIEQIRTKLDNYGRTRLCMRKRSRMAGLATLELADMVQRMEVELEANSLFPAEGGYEWNKPHNCFAREQWKWMSHIASQHLDTIMSSWRSLVDPFEIEEMPDPDDESDAESVVFVDDDGNTIPDEEMYMPGDCVMPPIKDLTEDD